MCRFRFDEHFEAAQAPQFFRDLFASEAWRSLGRVLTANRRGAWGTGAVEKVELRPVSCTLTSLDFFDRLTSMGLVRHDGSIKQCIDEYVDGISLADEVKKVCALNDVCV
jgi:hypothetical protein